MCFKVEGSPGQSSVMRAPPPGMGTPRGESRGFVVLKQDPRRSRET